MKKLIVNADDFGRTHGINLGILECFKNGIVTSATVMINMPFAQEAIQIAIENKIPLGLHLNITGGEMYLTGTNYLFGDKGKVKEAYKNKGSFSVQDMTLIIKEYEAQIAEFFRLAKKMPTHLDHHHNLQEVNGYLDIYMNFIKRIQLPTRTRHKINGVKAPNTIIHNFFTDSELTKVHLLDLIVNVPDGISELIAHPSLITGESLDSYTEVPRFKQVQLLTDAEVIQAVKKLNIKLVSYEDL
ncbi:MAG: ChbG/HpnK family deacetylase [Patescibacteria group bacterium]